MSSPHSQVKEMELSALGSQLLSSRAARPAPTPPQATGRRDGSVMDKGVTTPPRCAIPHWPAVQEEIT